MFWIMANKNMAGFGENWTNFNLEAQNNQF